MEETINGRRDKYGNVYICLDNIWTLIQGPLWEKFENTREIRQRSVVVKTVEDVNWSAFTEETPYELPKIKTTEWKVKMIAYPGYTVRDGEFPEEEEIRDALGTQAADALDELARIALKGRYRGDS